uniref:Uncharacterized protein n=1 Tax=Ciona savignyi TaxID=51511 RepID=H2YH35_CIOSA
MEMYMTRKKPVPEHYSPNSYRIFHSEIGDASSANTSNYRPVKETPASHPREPDRRNCPHPWNSRFLRHNVKVLNKPICVIATNATDAEQHDWWPRMEGKESKPQPCYTRCTTQRADYQRHNLEDRVSNAGNQNPNKNIVPLTSTDCRKRSGEVLLEKISYRHNYNSRLDPSEPIRGKLHGSFVWDQVKYTKPSSPNPPQNVETPQISSS